MNETIFAVASGAGRVAVTVLRLSGADTGAVLDALCRTRPPPRRASLRTLRDGAGEVLDRALVLWFPGPHSYTGEDAAELHLHGGRAVAEGVAAALVALGARPAEPGDFTRRAFLNGRMDLLEAEAVADLVEAETAEQRRQALRQMDGALGGIYRAWADRLRLLLADQEALIDFPDEDLPEEVEVRTRHEIAALHQEIAAHLADGRRGERLREGLVFAIIGAPNVGKSSLLNALAEREVSIVSARPGTTRDALEARLDLGGVPVTLVDTAGLRETEDEIEAEGVRRARRHAEAADLVVTVTDAASPDLGAMAAAGALVVANKIDLAPAPAGVPGVSAATGEGIATLRARLGEIAREMVGAAGPPPLTRVRHRACLREAVRQLEEATDARLAELRGENLRLALRSLGRITGAVGAEDILDTIFSRFCIGK